MLLGKDACLSVHLQTGAEQLLCKCWVVPRGEQGRELGSRHLAASRCSGPGARASAEGLVLVLAALLAQSARLPSACGILGLTSQIIHILDKKAGREVPSSLSFLRVRREER